ncbi:MAG: DUF2059 domain-containing protein [Fibromonadales bacterium]|nr:DUF2059 domain-containing protein [Fibromonadales bacterium]
MKKLSLALLVTLCAVFSAYGQTKKQDIIKLLDVTGAKAQMAQMADMMIANMQASVPTVPQEFWTKFKTGLKSDSFIDLLIPIYDKHLSHDDVKKLIQFYESPIGKKIVQVTPQITQDSYVVGEQWGKKLAADIMAELAKQGYF